MYLLPSDTILLPPYEDRVFKLIFSAPQAKTALINLISAATKRSVIDVVEFPFEVRAFDPNEQAESIFLSSIMEDGSQANIEIQSRYKVEPDDSGYENFYTRRTCNLFSLHASQNVEGIAYNKLANTIQVTFCGNTIFPQHDKYYSSFALCDVKHDVVYPDSPVSIFVELSKLKELLGKPVETMTDLEKWLVFLGHAADLSYRDIVNQVIDSNEALGLAGNLLVNVSQDEEERAIFLNHNYSQSGLETR